MKEVLDIILPRVFPETISFITIPHNGKGDLENSIPKKLKAWNMLNSDVEYGNKGMSIKNLYLLSQLLGVSAEYLLSGKLYSLDNDEESLRVHEEIVSLLKECTPEQIESFRRISQIFADDMKRVAPEKTKSSIKFKK